MGCGYQREMNGMTKTAIIAIVATVRKTSSIIGHLLLKLNARSIDDPADPAKLPLRP